MDEDHASRIQDVPVKIPLPELAAKQEAKASYPPLLISKPRTCRLPLEPRHLRRLLENKSRLHRSAIARPRSASPV